MSTRFLLHSLCSQLCLPAFILADADPYGLDIMATYRFGSVVPSVLIIPIHVRNLYKLDFTSGLLFTETFSLNQEISCTFTSLAWNPSIRYWKIWSSTCPIQWEGSIKSKSNFFKANYQEKWAIEKRGLNWGLHLLIH